MKISQFITKVLFDENCGYYQTKNPLGSKGDFITAPEISQIFGEILALYLLNIYDHDKKPFSLVEMGAGRGTLLQDILQTLHKLARKNNHQAIDFLEQVNLHIIEINPVLTKIQQENLRQFSVQWHLDFAGFLSCQRGKIFFISNELFDCFAIDQYIKTSFGWCERLIKCDDEKSLQNPQFFLTEPSAETENFVAENIGIQLAKQAPLGAVFEYSKSAREFMNILCQALQQRGGIAINCDYGYCDYEFANSLQAVKNHQKVNLFASLFDADITCHVDFVALDRIAKTYNLDSSLITQGEFLKNLGAIERTFALIKANPADQNVIESALHRLIDADKMGELFKVHIIWR